MERHLKIAIVGTCESSRELAPYEDDTWRKWLCGESNHTMPSADVWFELHAPHELTPKHQEWWIKFLSEQEFRIYMQEKHPAIPNSERFPIEAVRKEFPPPWFFTSTIAYMLAFAVMNPEVAEIGIWGVDMAHEEEYWHQKPGCLIYIMEAMRRGIKIFVPPESDLLQPLPLYAYAKNTPHARKFFARKKELLDMQSKFNKAIAEVEGMKHKLERDLARVEGGLQNQGWIERTYG
jgi:hypothetical protein